MLFDQQISASKSTWRSLTLVICATNALILSAAPSLVTERSPFDGGGSLEVVIDNVTSVACHSDQSGSAEAVVNGGVPPYSYTWSTVPAQNGAQLVGVGIGIYTVIVEDSQGSTASASVSITGPSEPLEADITSFTNVLCNTTSTGIATVSVTGGTPPYTYQWNTSPVQTDATATGLGIGTFTVEVTDANGCMTSSNVTISDSSEPILALVEDYSHVSCFGFNDGFINLTLSGASNSFTVTWNTNPPVTGPLITGLSPGLYQAEIIDNNGCDTPKYISFGILGPTAPLAVTLDVTNASCHNTFNGSVDLTITGGNAPYFQTWYDLASGQSTNIQDLSGLDPGTYLLSVVDAFGCGIDTSVVITAPTPLTVQTTIASASCAPGSLASITSAVSGGTAPYSYAWTGPDGFSANTPTIEDLTSGNYDLTVTDQNGCTNSASVTISDPTPPSLSITTSIWPSGTELPCAGATNGTIDLAISGGAAPFAINWTDGLGLNSTDEDLTGLGAGTYQVSVTDANGCLTTASVTLSAPPSIQLSSSTTSIGAFNTSCALSADGNIDLTVDGGSAPYTYSWSNGADLEDLTNIAAGSYTVVVTDANGCTEQSTFSLTAPPAINVELIASTYPNGGSVSCAENADGSITATISGGTPGYQLQWSGPDGFASTAAFIDGLAPGPYTLVVTDDNQCVQETSTTLVPPPPFAITLASTILPSGANIACAGANTGAISSVVNGGTPAYAYSWSGPDGYASNDVQPTNLVAGTYSVIVTDANGCIATSSIELTEPDSLEATVVTSDIGGYGTSCTAVDGTLSTTITGGAAPYSITWNGPNGFSSTAPDLTDLIAGTYTITILDVNGCTVQQTVSLVPAPPVFVTLDPQAGPCPNDDQGSITVSLTGGTAPFTTTWSGPQGFTSNDLDIQQLIDGSYTLTLIDALGCTAQAIATIAGPEPISTDANLSFYGLHNIQCLGDSSGTIQLNPEGGTTPYAIDITGPNGYSGTGNTLEQLVAGNYTITITDANGCTADTSITLTSPTSLPDLELSASLQPSGTNISCFGGSDGEINATIDGGSAPYSYQWQGPSGPLSGTTTLSGAFAGTYSLTITDANACAITSTITLVQPDEALTSSAEISEFGEHNITCAGATDGSIALTITGGSGGYTVAWTGPNGFVSSDASITALAAGVYTASVTDLNGCTLQQNYTLTAPLPLEAGTLVNLQPGGTAISCQGANDGSISALANGGAPIYTYAWTGPNGAMGGQQTLVDLGPGNYCVLVTDAQGCTAQACTTISEPDALAAIASSTDANCGTANGAIDLNINGGTGPFATIWSNGQTTEDLPAVAAGDYTVTITDTNGCNTSLSATITGTPATLINATITDEQCAGANAGAIDLNITSGTAPFQINWSTGATTEDLSSLSAGSYIVTVSDANGCTAQGSYSVNAPPSLAIDTTLSVYQGGYNVSSWQGQDGSIDVTVSGGEAPYRFAWSNGGNSEDLAGLGAGTYVLTITDANGCSNTIEIVLTQPSDLAMPTGFTPNGDGANDTFFIRGLDAYPTNQLIIMNRWGNKVFERINYRNDWTGESLNGGELPNGTYFAILSVNNGQRTLQGYVDLRR
ncbi:MAG: gliding motility-associated C-terminal domain-containing protein [Flavobacteriales bacterium]|nr:gliding motility-associated C-terminal domain-containing protein [Flavobacteriales bacterium]